LLGVDLLTQPELAASPEVAFRTAALYWQKNGLNEVADRSDFANVIRKVSGARQGNLFEQQQNYFTRAKTVFGIQ
jgi:putative chitinase